MLEIHPFPPYIPKNAKYLLLGSFVGVRKDNSYDWYYSNSRNQFWKIIGRVYGIELVNKTEKKKFLSKLSMSITDIIYKCERKVKNNSDTSLINITYNKAVIDNILKNNKIGRIYFTSRYVEHRFKKIFPEVEGNTSTKLITLPSPSPRYATRTLDEKIKIYKSLLPPL